ncbi:MAG: TonB-dependent receptor [Paludibacter sp.]|nr:TonB-dependent receptor [Paludibacter sp.]
MKNKIPDYTKTGRHLLHKMLWTVIFVLVAQLTFAQTLTVKGKVKDSQGLALPGVSILVQGTSTGTVTDLDGYFSIAVPSSKSVLVCSFIGMVTQNIVVGNQLSLAIVLNESSVVLNEVVSIGYGSVKKSSLTGAVSKLTAEALGERPIARVETALQGTMPGVEVRTTTGQPGQDIEIRVRGAASVNASSNPLYVVDGAPVSSLSGINPADISTVEVLKDAASTAIYGSRGSNGVVIVTTKTGNSGKSGKPIISFDANYGTQTLERKMDMLSATEWMNFRMKYNDATYLSTAASKGIANASISDPSALRMTNIGGTMSAPNFNVINDDRWFQYLSSAAQASHTYDATKGQLSLLDWQDNFFRSAPTQEYNISVSGGTGNTKFMFSGGYLNQQGIATGTGFKRISLRSNIETKINNWLSAGLIIAPTYSTTIGGGLADGKDSKTHQTLSSTPVSEPGVGYFTNVQPNTKYDYAGSTSSTTYIMNTNLANANTLLVNATSFVRIEPFKGFKVQATASTNYSNMNGETYNYSSAGGAWASGEGVNSSGGHTTATRIDNSLFQTVANYDNTFGKHTLGVMLGFSAEESSVGYQTNQSFNKPFPNDALPESFNGTVLAVGTDLVTKLTPNRLESFFGRAQYNYDGRYFISGSIRRDGGSVFGINNKWGTFPAISGAWNISDESFFKNLKADALNLLKLRASYGVTGNNAISQTASYALLTAITYAGQAGYSINTFGNPNLGWEKSKSTDLALDLGLFNNRVQLSLDYYTKKTTDLLYMVPVPGATGFTLRWDNLGDIDNKGFEIELNTKNIIGAFKWSTNFNLGYNENTIKRLGATNTPVYSGFDNTNVSNVLQVGLPMNTFYMYQAEGVWKTQAEIDAYSAAHNGTPVTFNGTAFKPGDIRYHDVNGDGIITTDDKSYLGSPSPKFTYGLTNTFEYKNFDLSVLLTAQSGGKILGILGRALDRPGMGALSNVFGNWRNAWWSETEQGDGKTPYILSSTTGTTIDSRWLYSSDYIRIKNISFGYRLPARSKIYSSARIYLSVENLAILTGYTGGYSPEAANSGVSGAPGGGNSLGIDYGGYPTSRVISMGINVTF